MRSVVVSVFLVADASGHLTFPLILVSRWLLWARLRLLSAGVRWDRSARCRDAYVAVGELVARNRTAGERGSRAGNRCGDLRLSRPIVGLGARGGFISRFRAAVWLTRPRAIAAKETSRGIVHELAEGFRYVTSVPWIWMGIAASTVNLMIAMAPFTALLPGIVRTHYERGVGSYGLLFSMMSAGMVAGSLAWARWHPARGRVAVCFASFGVAYIGIVVVALAPWYWLAVAGVSWRGFWIGVGTAAWLTLVMELVPDGLLSRVFSFDFFGSSALTPVGYALAAALATAVAPTMILVVGGSVALALWLAPLTRRRVRTAA
jgi:hypothetical protein